MKSLPLLGSIILFLPVCGSLQAQCIPACDAGETCCGTVCVDAALRFTFVDETSARGIDPVHESAENPQIDGPGIAAGDFDGDGWIDLFIPQAPGQFDRLYRNRGPGKGRLRVSAGLLRSRLLSGGARLLRPGRPLLGRDSGL